MRTKTKNSSWESPISDNFKFFYEERTELDLSEEESVLVSVDCQADLEEALNWQLINQN